MSIENGQPGMAADPLVSLTSAGVAFHIQHGLDAAKSATPQPGWVYVATDTGLLYVCYAENVWTELAVDYADNWAQVDCKASGPTTAFSFTLRAHDLSTDGDLILEILGSWSNSTGGNRTATVTFNFGAGSVAITPAATATGNSGSFRISIYVSNTAADAQKYYMFVWLGTISNAHYMKGAVGTLAVDTTVDVAVSVQIGWSVLTTTCLKTLAQAQLFTT